MDESRKPLNGVTVVTTAVNLPGPVAAHRLHALGAAVTKVEPPVGDPLAVAVPDYYRFLADGQDVVTVDLKTDDGRGELAGLLRTADLLLTSHRVPALKRLGLGWERLHREYPSLSQVAVVGHTGEDADVPGHDLTFQADAGTLGESGSGAGTPPLPALPVADLGGAERAVAAATTALFGTARTGEGTYTEVALVDVVDDFAASLRFGLSGPGSPLGGGLPTYGIYPASSGHVAVAAIEPHFMQSLASLTGLGSVADITPEALTAFFSTDTAEHWAQWGRENGLPVTALRSGSAPR